MSGYTTFEWVTLGIWIVVIGILIYGIVAIHDIPASIARKRHHPHADAIEAAGWVSLFMLHALWPFLWIWAMTYKPGSDTTLPEDSRIESLEMHVEDLQRQLNELESKGD